MIIFHYIISKFNEQVPLEITEHIVLMTEHIAPDEQTLSIWTDIFMGLIEHGGLLLVGPVIVEGHIFEWDMQPQQQLMMSIVMLQRERQY